MRRNKNFQAQSHNNLLAVHKCNLVTPATKGTSKSSRFNSAEMYQGGRILSKTLKINSKIIFFASCEFHNMGNAIERTQGYRSNIV